MSRYNPLFKARFRRPFVYRNEDREKHNYDTNAIVLVDKIPYYIESVAGADYYSYVSKFEWRIVIDLWVVAIRLNWIGRRHAPPKV